MKMPKNIPAVVSALVLTISVFLPWIISHPRFEVHVHPGYSEITGLAAIPVALWCLVLTVYENRWAFKLAGVCLGLVLMCIFRVYTGESIAGAKMDLAYGVYIALAAAVVLVLATRKYHRETPGREA